MYYPKSQIKTNLYTNGREYVIKNTTQDYIGFYYQTSNGKLYIGKNPQGQEQTELVIPKDAPATAEDYKDDKVRIALFDSDPDPVFSVDEELFNGIAIVEYTNLLGKDTLNLETRSTPPPYHSQPTTIDINNGEYQRYFSKKTNELIYIEISIETYLSFSNGDPKFATDLYEVISLPWSLGGNAKSINRNIVTLVEKDNNWYGFSSYFRGNFG
jgi:hypothetical protein